MLTADAILKLEHDSIAAFVASCSGQLGEGRVLDLGCGQQPYRPIVESAGGEYVPFDRAGFAASRSDGDVGDDPFEGRHSRGYAAVLCTQVIQYQSDPLEFLRDARYLIRDDGWLVVTGPTNWRVIEPDDRFRFTVEGIRELLETAGFHVSRAEFRASIDVAPGFSLPLGWGALARS